MSACRLPERATPRVHGRPRHRTTFYRRCRGDDRCYVCAVLFGLPADRALCVVSRVCGSGGCGWCCARARAGRPVEHAAPTTRVLLLLSSRCRNSYRK